MTPLLDALDQHHAQLLLRLVLGGLLLLAGVTKLADRAGFRQAVAEYEILPERLQRPFATLLPWLETTLGVLLLLGLGTAIAASLATPLFLSFALAIGVNLLRGRDFDCHCFGSVQSEQIGWPALLRSTALVLAALVVAIGASPFGALDAVVLGSTDGLPPVAEVIPVVFLAAVVFDVLILLPETLAFRAIFARANRVRITGSGSNGHHPNASTLETESAT
ncbi:MAG: DoxX family membrane protein [Chloroflexi bacterium]|nr:DoxX family membrane protein [Chloroflexota bacterium]